MTKKSRKHFFTGVARFYPAFAYSVRLGLRSLAMGVEPDFRLLARGGDLRLGHLRSQPFESRFAVLVALGERERRPEVGFGQILRNSTARPVVGTERSLRGNMPLVGGAHEPLHGLHIIPRNTLSVMVAHAHLPLCVRVSLSGELSQVWHGLRRRALIGRAMIGNRRGRLGRLDH